MEIVTAASGSKYIYERQTGYLSLMEDSTASPNLFDSETYRHAERTEYLKRQGLVMADGEPGSEYRLLEWGDIEDALADAHQIVLEVTDRCNLGCHYCGYGHLYDNYDARENKDMRFETFQTVYCHLKDMWESLPGRGCTYLRISFYGGEPLCNFPFISKAVAYVKENPVRDRKIIFSMTTNAVLLDRYMDFLVENEFELLISLDGDRHNDSYRTYKDGTPSFDKVVANIDRLKSEYPAFFAEKVSFNSVLHDRNSVRDASAFIFERYGVYPITSELNVFGISKKMQQEFLRIFRSKTAEFDTMSKEDREAHESRSPYRHGYAKWVSTALKSSYSKNISDAFAEQYSECGSSSVREIPTKTCIPFSRKIFVTVNGGIFPCERIGNEFYFGRVADGRVEIDYDRILSQYNGMLAIYKNLCKGCKSKDFCSVCVVSDIKGYESCSHARPRDISEILSYFEKSPETLVDIVRDTVVI